MTEAPFLYLITPPLESAEPFTPLVEAASKTGLLACVLLRFATADERHNISITKALAPLAQQHNIAVLVEAPAIVAMRGGADGLHCSMAEALEEAIETLKPERIVGAGPFHSRDDAMIAGEKDIDYLMFGLPDHQGQAAVFEDTMKRTQWWAELFTVPAVAYAANEQQALGLGKARADFLALGGDVWHSEATVVDALQSYSKAFKTGPLA